MRAALTQLGAINISTNVSDRTCQFDIPTEWDIEAKLNEGVELSSKLKGWSKLE